MKTLIKNYINGNITEAKKQAKRHKQSAIPAPASPVPLPAFTPIDGAVTATLNFQSHETAKAFARKWAMHTLRGYALSRRGDDGAAVLTLYRVTKDDKQWIDAEVAAQATQAPIPAPASPVPLPAFRVHMDDGTSYLTSMAHGVTLETARRYFIGMRQVREDMRTGEERTSIVINVEVAQ